MSDDEWGSLTDSGAGWDSDYEERRRERLLNRPHIEPVCLSAAERRDFVRCTDVPMQRQLWRELTHQWWVLRPVEGRMHPLRRISANDARFPNLRHLVYEPFDPPHGKDMQKLSRAFPNLTSLCVSNLEGQPWEGLDLFGIAGFTQLKNLELRIHGINWYDSPGAAVENLTRWGLNLQHLRIDGVRGSHVGDWKALETLGSALVSLHFTGENGDGCGGRDVLVGKGLIEDARSSKVSYLSKPVPYPNEEAIRACTVDLSHLGNLKSVVFLGAFFCTVEELEITAAGDYQALLLPDGLHEVMIGNEPGETYEDFREGGGCTPALGAIIDELALSVDFREISLGLSAHKPWSRTLEEKLQQFEEDEARYVAQDRERAEAEAKRAAEPPPAKRRKANQAQGNQEPLADRTCDVCKKVLKSAQGMQAHKRDTHLKRKQEADMRADKRGQPSGLIRT